MTFTLADDQVWSVRIGHDLIDPVTNQPTYGLAEYSSKSLYLDSTTPRDRRVEALTHELEEACAMVWGDPITREAKAQRATRVLALLTNTFVAQGGIDALNRLFSNYEPAPAPALCTDDAVRYEPWDPNAIASLPVLCVICRRAYPSTAVENSEPAFDARRGLVIRRSLACEDCSHVQRWTERSDPMGRPTLQVVESPTFAPLA
jgi:hypothetical protein